MAVAARRAIPRIHEYSTRGGAGHCISVRARAGSCAGGTVGVGACGHGDPSTRSDRMLAERDPRASVGGNLDFETGEMRLRYSKTGTRE